MKSAIREKSPPSRSSMGAFHASPRMGVRNQGPMSLGENISLSASCPAMAYRSISRISIRLSGSCPARRNRPRPTGVPPRPRARCRRSESRRHAGTAPRRRHRLGPRFQTSPCELWSPTSPSFAVGAESAFPGTSMPLNVRYSIFHPAGHASIPFSFTLCRAFGGTNRSVNRAGGWGIQHRVGEARPVPPKRRIQCDPSRSIARGWKMAGAAPSGPDAEGRLDGSTRTDSAQVAKAIRTDTESRPHADSPKPPLKRIERSMAIRPFLQAGRRAGTLGPWRSTRHNCWSGNGDGTGTRSGTTA